MIIKMMRKTGRLVLVFAFRHYRFITGTVTMLCHVFWSHESSKRVASFFGGALPTFATGLMGRAKVGTTKSTGPVDSVE